MELESTTMPAVRQWVRTMRNDMGCSTSDHIIAIWVNCPSLGIMGASHKAFVLSFVTNVLSDSPENSICFLVHPNRAGQQEGRPVWENYITCLSKILNSLFETLLKQLSYFILKQDMLTPLQWI